VASLDVANGSAVMETLRRIASGTGLTVIATLHHVEYARRYADRVLGLAGRLVFDGPPSGLDDAAIARIFGDERPGPLEAMAPPLAVAEWAAG
jgi:phosphonate transport system ATP-binding protein